MEDVLQFLFIAGALAFGIYRQFNKEKSNNSEKQTPMPVPEHEPEYEPVSFEKPQKKIIVPPKPLHPKEGIRSTYVPITMPKATEEEEVDQSEFSIQSAEEARRAIIWSEILQRKY